MLICDNEKKIHEESLLESFGHNSSSNQADSENMFLNTYNFHKNNIKELLSIRHIKQNAELYTIGNQLEGLNKNMEKNFSYIYFQLTLMTVLKKFNSTHNLLTKMVNDNFEKTFNDLNLNDKLFITKLTFKHNNTRMIIISKFYKKLFSKQYNLDTYNQMIISNPELEIIFSNINVIIRFFGDLPNLEKEDSKEEILNIYRTIKNLSTVIFKSPENYFSICKLKLK
jgi:hypothetical protein